MADDLKIDNILQSLRTYPMLDLSKYKVAITGPGGALDETLTVRCSAVSLPGRGITTTEKYHHGPIRKIPYSEAYDDVSISFIASSNLTERKFFDDWQRLIGGGNSYYIAWYEEIIGTVAIMSLDKRGNVMSTTTLYEAYPMTMEAIAFDSASGDAIPLLTVTFAYHHWETKTEAIKKDPPRRTQPAEKNPTEISPLGPVPTEPIGTEAPIPAAWIKEEGQAPTSWTTREDGSVPPSWNR